jgi:hypothetical protein
VKSSTLSDRFVRRSRRLQTRPRTTQNSVKAKRRPPHPRRLGRIAHRRCQRRQPEYRERQRSRSCPRQRARRTSFPAADAAPALPDQAPRASSTRLSSTGSSASSERMVVECDVLWTLTRSLSCRLSTAVARDRFRIPLREARSRVVVLVVSVAASSPARRRPNSRPHAASP